MPVSLTLPSGASADLHTNIFGVAHYGAVADLFDVAEELEKLF